MYATIVYIGSFPLFSTNESEIQIRPHCVTLSDVLVPTPDRHILTLPGVSPVSEESKEDWKERMEELFEWVGMVCVGSERSVFSFS